MGISGKTKENKDSCSSQAMQVTPLNDESCKKDDTSSKPPDGGWGWIIVLASFLCNLVVDGIIFSFGLLKQDIANTFNKNIGTVAWIGSLQAGCYLVIGPVVSALTDRFGCRVVTIFGSFIATIGFIASYYAQSVVHLMITYGVIGGIGFGWIYLPAIVTVGYYFDSKRAFATGIAVCGSGIGTFVMPLLITKLLTMYQWNTCILILSTLIMTCTLFGAFFKPIVAENQDEASSLYTNSVNMWTVKDGELNSEGDTVKSDYNSSSPPSYSAVVANEFFAPLSTRTSLTKSITRQFSSLTDVTNNQTLKRASTTAEVFTARMKSSDSFSSLFKRPFQYDLLSPSESITRKVTQSPDPGDNNVSNILRHHSTANVTAHECNVDLIDTQDESTYYVSQKKLKSLTSNNNESSETESMASKEADSFVYLDPELCRSPSFLLMSLSGFLTLAGFFVPFMYIIDLAVSLGYTPEESGVLLSIIGVTNTIGRVFSGWISDQPRVDALLVNNISLIVGGAATILSPILCYNFISLAIYGSIFGFCIACFAALRSVMVVDLFGREKLNAAFGLLLLPQGIATIIGTPFAGWLSEITGGSTDISFYVAGSFILVSGLMCVPLKRMSMWSKSQC